MAARSRRTQKQKVKTQFRIEAAELRKLELGHQPHISGTGPHSSKPKRQRTRKNAAEADIMDQLK